MQTKFAKNSALRALTAALGFVIAGASAAAAPSLKALQADSAHLQLGNAPYDLKLAVSKSTTNVNGVSMASADFNIDGTTDLVSGYASNEGGFIAINRGNKAAYSPTSAADFANLEQGIFPQGFVSESEFLKLPVAPELLVAGDFNADGKPDLVFAKRGDNAMYFLPGSRSGFGVAQKIELDGTLDAMAAGEVDLPNAAIDLALAITAKSGASLEIYRDGISNKPLGYKLAAPADQLAIGNLDDSLMGDVAILAAGELSILHGYNQRAGLPSFSRMETLSLGSKSQSFALGDFIWDREGKTEIALMQADGAVAFAARGALNSTPFSVAEVREKRRAQIAAKSTSMKSWQPGTGGAWAIKESNAGVVSKAMALRGAKLLRANLAGQSSDDLIVVDALSQTLKLLTVEGAQRKSYSVSSSGSPIAALAIPTSSFVLPSLIVLRDGAAAPSVLPSVPKALFTVSKVADTNDGACNADCSLREAIVAANAAAGADSITVPAGTYTLMIANTGGVNEDNSAQGDLDIDGPLAITGAGLATTIIQGGTTNANGIDKVLAFNPFCTAAMNMSLSDVTVRFGRNSQPRPTLLNDFSWTGGGIDVCNASTGTFAMNNVLVDQNTNLNSYSGGINLDSVQPASGSYSITGSTISGNRTTSSASTTKFGGGIGLQGDTHSVTITNTTIMGNISASEGGGVFAAHVNGGAILIQGSTINNNTAASRGGGVSNSNFGVSTLTLNNDGFVQSNVSQGTLVSTESRGGGIFISAQNTSSTSINEMSITGNTANTGTFQGGGGVATISAAPLTLTFNRIAGNTAGTGGGAGLHNAGAPITGTRNWWGCNAGPTVAPCDLAVTTSGTSTLTPRLQLAHAASPSTIVVGQTSALTAGFLTDSASGAVALANLDAIIGTTHAHSAPVLGTHSATQATIQATGNATATFTATAAGAGSSSSMVDAQTQTVAITINKANTTTTITSDTPDPSNVSQVVAVNYSVAVTAPGAGTPTGNVVVTISGGAETCTGTVAAGTCNITLIGTGARTLTATYAGDSNFNGSNGTAAHQVNSAPSADLGITKTDGVASVTAGGSATYTITASNAGPDNVTGATVTDTFPAATTCTWTCVGAGGGTCAASGVGNISNSVNLPAGGSVTYTASCTISAAATGSLANTATVASAVSDPTPGNNSATDTDSIVRTANLGITKTDGVTSVNAGGSATYTITASNAGLSNAQATVADTFPASLTCTWTCVGAGGGTCTAAGAGNINDSVNLPVGGSATYTASCSISAGATGTLSNTATVTAASGITDPTPGNNSATDTDTIVAVPSLSINDVTISEGNSGTSNATFTVSLSSPAQAGGVSFNVATANGTATAGTDYVAISLTSQTIPAGNSTYSFTVLVNGDSTNEPNETFFVNVTGVTGANVADAQGLGTITNDDALPSLSIDSISVTEGNAGTASAGFTVSLSAASGQTVTVNFATADGTATAPSDYASASGTITFTPGQTTRPITVLVNGDTTPEPNETFAVNLSGATNATIATASGTGTILNDDSPVATITVAPASVLEDGATNLDYAVALSQAALSPITVNISTSGTAISGTDYTGAVATLVIPPGNLSGTITIDPSVDAAVEANETVILTIASGTGYTVGSPASATGTITNDDVPSVSIAVAPASVLEDGAPNLVYTVTLNQAAFSPTTVNLTTTGTATSGTDYTGAVATVVIATGNTTGTVTIDPTVDTTIESNETVIITLATGAGYTVGAPNSATGTITDDDLPGVSIAVAPSSVLEDGAANLVYTISLAQAALSPLTVNLTTTGSATSGTDYSGAVATVLIPTGNLSGTVTIDPTADTAIEANETVILTVTAGSGYNVGAPASATGTINNDDVPAISIAVAPASVLEDGAGNLLYTLSLDQAALSVTTVTISTTGTASSGTDYIGGVATLNIPAGNISGSITIDPSADAVLEANETVILTVVAGSGYIVGSPASATGTITNDDTAGITLTQSSGSTDVTEGGAADTYTLVLTSQPTSNVVITLTPDSQVTAAPSPITFTSVNWNVAQIATVSAVDDLLVEGPHTGTISHVVTSVDSSYSAFVLANVVANVTDNDLPTLAINDVSITEGNSGTSILNFTVTRTGTTPFAVGFNFATSDGTATVADSDYVSASGTGTIPSGGASATTTVSVTINGDAFFENAETFNVNVSAPTNAAISDNLGVGTISNDDIAPVLTINDQTVVEGNAGIVPMVFTITRTGLTKLPATAVFASADGTATAPSDYTAVNGTATVAADTQNVATTTVTVLVNGDTLIENNETLFLNLSTPGNATTGDNQGLGTITNDDGPPSFTPAGAITRQQGSPAAPATLGTVSDLTDPAGSLAVAIIADSTVGVTTTGLTNTNGTVTATIAASCTATAGSLTVQVTDLGGLTDMDDVQINVSANTPPTLTYANFNVGVGTSSTQNPSAGLNDNGSVASIVVQSAGTYTGGISVSSTGVISLNNASPAGTHTITVRATDNCGANTDAMAQVTVNQATTFKAVTSNVSPSRFGQALTLSAQLSGVDPTGTVEFFAGAVSLGSAPLTPSPSGGTSLKLASLSTSTLAVGNSNITVVYAGDTNNAASTSAILLQTVQAADTVISLSPAANPAVVGPSTINIQVQALAPGGGIPAGMVMLSAGPGNTCVATLTAGNGSCALNFTASGYFAITASYTPANGNHLASIGGTALVVVGIPSSTDLRVRIGNGVRNIGAGQTVRYDIVVDNIGTQAAVGRLQVPLSADYSSATFSCQSAGPANCGNASTSTGSIDKEVSLAPGGVVIYSLVVTAPISPERTITQTASITAKAPTTDIDLSNNNASDIDPMGLLSDGFEDQVIGE